MSIRTAIRWPRVWASARRTGFAPNFPAREQGAVLDDHVPFIRAGVPAVYLDGGAVSTEPGVDGLALMREFLGQHYHRPSDDLSRPIHWPSAARLALLNQRIAREIGNADERPRWNAGDFFGERFGTAATKAR